MSKYQDWLIEHINQTDGFIHPEFRKSQVLEFLKEPLNDICISRPVERLSWGIPLPFDPQYVTYVWFDALVNYVSAAQYGEEDFSAYWPADVHVIGKDILAPPHAVYWPIMLQACNLAQRQLGLHLLGLQLGLAGLLGERIVFVAAITGCAGERRRIAK